jgi:putative solute:sodium symporter small subunit
MRVTTLQSAVRPTVTWGLVAAQIGLGFAWAFGVGAAPEAFKSLAAFTGTTLGFWFASRGGNETRDA